MTEKEKLYEVMGELLFAVAKADGIVQEQEKESLKSLLSNHPWANEIMWSFNYEDKKQSSVEDLYKKVISFCQSYGPASEYKEFVEAMKVIADSSNGIDEQESSIINSFSEDLITRFQEDISVK